MQIFTFPIMTRNGNDTDRSMWVHKYQGYEVHITVWESGGTVVVELSRNVGIRETTQILMTTDEARALGAQLVTRCVR